jgi:formate hydrogenlyase subunit 4
MIEVLVLLVEVGVYATVAPGVVGLLEWFKARLQARRGANIWQPYRDLWKLLRKRPNLPESASWLFSTVPPIVFVCYLLLGLFLPTFFLADPVPSPAFWQGFRMDFLFIVYLLGLARFAAGLAAFDIAALYGSMSSGRQFFVHILAEPVLFVTLYALVLTKHSSNIAWLMRPASEEPNIAALIDPAMVLTLLALGSVFLAEGGRLPYDNPDTHLELTMVERGTYLAYTGRALALIEWAHAMKLTFFLSLVVGLGWPWSMATEATLPALGVALVSYLVKLVLLLFLLALWELIQVKLRLRRIVHPLTTALVFALIAVVYTVATGYLSGG